MFINLLFYNYHFISNMVTVIIICCFASPCFTKITATRIPQVIIIIVVGCISMLLFVYQWYNLHINIVVVGVDWQIIEYHKIIIGRMWYKNWWYTTWWQVMVICINNWIEMKFQSKRMILRNTIPSFFNFISQSQTHSFTWNKRIKMFNQCKINIQTCAKRIDVLIWCYQI